MSRTQMFHHKENHITEKYKKTYTGKCAYNVHNGSSDIQNNV